MKIEILGAAGCSTCTELARNVKRVVEELGIDATVEKVEDLAKIMSYGVMSTPALVVDGKVRMSGRNIGLDEIKKILTQ